MVDRDASGRVKAGSVLNPHGGRAHKTSKYLSVAEALRRIGSEPFEGEMPRAEMLARVAWSKAIAGELEWARLVIEHIDGKPIQRVAGDDSEPPISIRMIEVVKSYASEPVDDTGE
jgi:hypothetical protein